MRDFSTLRSGTLIKVDVHGIHDAIVIDAVPGVGAVIIICGTSKSRDYPEQAQIEPSSPTGRRWGLTQTTYFFPSGVRVISDPELVKSQHGFCEQEKFAQVREVVEAAAARHSAASAHESSVQAFDSAKPPGSAAST